MWLIGEDVTCSNSISPLFRNELVGAGTDRRFKIYLSIAPTFALIDGLAAVPVIVKGIP